jgi:hypothetical protein
MDKKKITRRAAIGLLIGAGLGAPFLIWFVRNKRRYVLPEITEMENNWNMSYEKIVPNVVSVNSVSRGQFITDTNTSIRYEMLIPIYSDLSVNTGKNQQSVPDSFMKKEGVAHFVTIDGVTILSGQDRDVNVVTYGKKEEFPKEEWAFAIRGSNKGNVVPVLLDMNNVKNMAWEQDPQSYTNMLTYYSDFLIDSPRDEVIVGDEWKIMRPFSGDFWGKATRCCSGICDIAGQKTFKITTSQHLDVDSLLQLSNFVLAQITDKTLRDQIQSEAKNVERLKYRMTVNNISYFDTQTGILVFRDYSKHLFSERDSVVHAREEFFIRTKI